MEALGIVEERSKTSGKEKNITRGALASIHNTSGIHNSYFTALFKSRKLCLHHSDLVTECAVAQISSLALVNISNLNYFLQSEYFRTVQTKKDAVATAWIWL